MAGSAGSGSNRWVVFLAVVIALILFNKYLLIGAQAVLGVLLPGSSPLVAQPDQLAAPEPTAYREATLAPAPTEAPAVAVEVEVTEAPAQPVTITIWHSWADDQLITIRPIFDEYTRIHPAVTIELVRQDDLVNVLPTILAAGEGPDLVVVSSSYIGTYAPEMLLPLDELGLDWYYMQSNFTNASVRTVVTGDHFWGLPIMQVGMALITNTAMLGEYTNIPNDVNMFVEMAKTYEQDNPGKKFFCNPGFAYKDPYYLAPILFSYADYGGFVDLDGTVSLDKVETIWAADLLIQYRDLSLANSDYSTCETAFMNGEVPIWWNGSWVLPQLEQSGIEYEVRGLGQPYMNTEAVMLPISARYRGNSEIALDVAEYIASAEVQTQMAISLFRIPASKLSILSSEVDSIPGIRGFSDALEVSIPLFSNKFTDLQWGPVQTALTSILDGEQTPTHALNAAQQTLEEQIAANR